MVESCSTRCCALDTWKANVDFRKFAIGSRASRRVLRLDSRECRVFELSTVNPFPSTFQPLRGIATASWPRRLIPRLLEAVTRLPMRRLRGSPRKPPLPRTYFKLKLLVLCSSRISENGAPTLWSRKRGKHKISHSGASPQRKALEPLHRRTSEFQEPIEAMRVS